MYDKMDFYLEEMFRLVDCCKGNEEACFRIMQIVQIHSQSCRNISCRCKETTFKTADNQIDKEEILHLIESMFLWSLKQKEIVRSLPHYEHMSLKYISFIAKYRNNPVKAYFELKSLMSSQKRQVSFYFEAIQEILAKRIEYMIVFNQTQKMSQQGSGAVQINMGLFVTHTDEESSSSKLSVTDFIFSDSFREATLPKMLEFTKQKSAFYDNLCSGAYPSLLEVSQDVSKLSLKAGEIQSVLQSFLGDLAFSSIISIKAFNKNVFILRILAIFERFVMGRFDISEKFEEVIKEMKKRDMLSGNLVVNTTNILRGKVQAVMLSMAKHKGRIINKGTASKLNKFFGYQESQTGDNQIMHISQLIPQFLAEIHDSLMSNYLFRGYSKYINGHNNYSFGLSQQGFLMPLSISFENIFEIKDDFCMYASMLKLDNYKEFIVFNSMGTILGITPSIFQNIFHPSHLNGEQGNQLALPSTYLSMPKKSPRSEAFSKNVFDVQKKVNFYMIMPDMIYTMKKLLQEGVAAAASVDQKVSDISSIRTICNATIGSVRVPQKIQQLQRTYKVSMANASERSRAMSISSFQTNLQDVNEYFDVVDGYDTFFKANKKGWAKESLFSQTKVKFDLIEQTFGYYKSKRMQTSTFYIMQINEKSEVLLGGEDLHEKQGQNYSKQNFLPQESLLQLSPKKTSLRIGSFNSTTLGQPIVHQIGRGKSFDTENTRSTQMAGSSSTRHNFQKLISFHQQESSRNLRVPAGYEQSPSNRESNLRARNFTEEDFTVTATNPNTFAVVNLGTTSGVLATSGVLPLQTDRDRRNQYQTSISQLSDRGMAAPLTTQRMNSDRSLFARLESMQPLGNVNDSSDQHNQLLHSINALGNSFQNNDHSISRVVIPAVASASWQSPRDSDQKKFFKKQRSSRGSHELRSSSQQHQQQQAKLYAKDSAKYLERCEENDEQPSQRNISNLIDISNAASHAAGIQVFSPTNEGIGIISSTKAAAAASITSAAAATVGTKKPTMRFWDVIKNTIYKNNLNMQSTNLNRNIYASSRSANPSAYEFDQQSSNMHTNYNMKNAKQHHMSFSVSDNSRMHDSEDEDGEDEKDFGDLSKYSLSKAGKSVTKTVIGGVAGNLRDQDGANPTSQTSSTNKMDKTNARYLMDIAHSRYTPQIFQKLKIFFFLMIACFVGLELIFDYGIVKAYSELDDHMGYQKMVTIETMEFSQQMINALNYEAIQSDLLDASFTSLVSSQISDTATSFSKQFSDRLQTYFTILSDSDIQASRPVFIFTNTQTQSSETKVFTESKLQTLDSMTKLLRINSEGETDYNENLFLYLLFNYHSSVTADMNLLVQLSSEIDNIHSKILTRELIFIISFVSLFLLLIVCFFPFLRDINDYQQRVILLLTRMSVGECASLMNTLQLFQNAVLSPGSDAWLSRNLSSFERRSKANGLRNGMNASSQGGGGSSNRLPSREAIHSISKYAGSKSNSQMHVKNMKMPVQSFIKVQSIPSLKKVIFFTVLSLIGSSYFAIFLIVISKYSASIQTYSSFLDFSMTSIPHISKVFVDWQTLLSYDSILAKNPTFPTIDRESFFEGYSNSSKIISNFMVNFPEKLQQFTGASSTLNSKLDSLYSSDICESYVSDCATLTGSEADKFNKGVSGLFSYYLQLFKNYNSLIDGSITMDEAVRKQILTEYFSESDFSQLGITLFTKTVQFSQEIFRITVESASTSYQNLSTLYEFYLIIFGMFIIITFSLMAAIFYLRNLQLVNNVNFGLTCLSSQKIGEESTLQMLKFIKKI